MIQRLHALLQDKNKRYHLLTLAFIVAVFFINTLLFSVALAAWFVYLLYCYRAQTNTGMRVFYLIMMVIVGVWLLNSLFRWLF